MTPNTTEYTPHGPPPCIAHGAALTLCLTLSRPPCPGRGKPLNPEATALKRLDDSLHADLRARTLPSFWRPGFLLCPTRLVPEVDRLLTEAGLDFGEAANAYEAAHRALMDTGYATVLLLDGHHEPHHCRLEWQWAELSVPTALQAFGLYDVERNKESFRRGEAAGKVRDLRRTELSRLLDDTLPHLAPDPLGRRSPCRWAVLARWREWLRFEGYRDLTGDLGMEPLVRTARRALAGVTPTALRENRDVRRWVRETLTEVRRGLDSLTEGDRPCD